MQRLAFVSSAVLFILLQLLSQTELYADQHWLLLVLLLLYYSYRHSMSNNNEIETCILLRVHINKLQNSIILLMCKPKYTFCI